MDTHRTKPSMPAMLVGAMLGLGPSALSIAVAAAWEIGVLEPDPNGVLVQTLQASWLPALVLSPIGLAIAALGAGVRSVLGWAAVLLWGVPILAVVSFISAVWLGGLAGEPF